MKRKNSTMADTAKNSKRCTDTMDFLWEVSNTLASVNDAKLLTDALKSIFEKYFSVNNFQVYIKDENTFTLRDFVGLLLKKIFSMNLSKIFLTH